MTALAVQERTPARGSLDRGVLVLAAGTQTSVQDLPGRTGLWSVGVPPSGAWDDLSASLANLAVGNRTGAALLEAVLRGPELRLGVRSLVCVTGAAGAATVGGRPVRPGQPFVVGPDVAPVLGSAATFLLGGFGGHDGRALAAGDVLALRSPENCSAPVDVREQLPVLGDDWEVRMLAGPHGAPEHLTDAGLHPSNLHDSAYPVGRVVLSGDTPVVVGPDGPSRRPRTSPRESSPRPHSTAAASAR